MPTGKTADLPGVEGEGVARKRIKKLDEAIDVWRQLVTKRMALSDKESEAKEQVNAIMHAEGIEVYLYTDDGDVEKECVLVETVKLRKVKDEEDD